MMNFPLARAVAITAGFTCSVHAAEETGKSNMKEVLKARIAEDARKVDPKKTPPPPSPAKSAPSPATAPAAGPSAAPAAGSAASGSPAAYKDPAAAKPGTRSQKEAPTVLPRIEVKKDRITELDQKLAKQEQDIARERKNLKASEVDTALNDGSLAKPLAIFGGESSQFRQRVASERVELMEAEKDIMEAMARAKTKEEKQELQKQLDQIKSFRRELEKSLR
jgi:hypothetical protein